MHNRKRIKPSISLALALTLCATPLGAYFTSVAALAQDKQPQAATPGNANDTEGESAATESKSDDDADSSNAAAQDDDTQSSKQSAEASNDTAQDSQQNSSSRQTGSVTQKPRTNTEDPAEQSLIGGEISASGNQGLNHYNLGRFYFTHWQLPLAEVEYEVSIMYAPAMKIAHRDYCLVSLLRGHPLRALAEMMMVVGLGGSDSIE